MRIALACPYAWDDPGGVQVHVRELGSRLRTRGHEVLVLTPARKRPQEPWVVKVGRPLDVTFNRSNAPISPWPSTRTSVRRSLAAFRPDVVHAHEPATLSVGLFSISAREAPAVATFHSGVERSVIYDLAAPVLRRALRPLEHRIAVSEVAAATARRRLGGEYQVIPNGIDFASWASAPARDLGAGTKLLFVGRLDERKGFAVALEAFAKLAANDPDLRLIVAGLGPAAERVRLLPSDVAGRVTLLGHVPNRDLPAVAAACDLYIGSATGGESFGIVLIEAMAAGLPVVASNIPGYDEVARDGIDSLLVPAGDAGALASAIARLLEDWELAQRLIEGGRERARGFDWEPIVDQVEAVYERVAGRMAS